jgi:chemotaxis protein CheD
VNRLQSDQVTRCADPENVVLLTPTERMPALNHPVNAPSAAEAAYVPPGRLLAARDGKPLTTIVSTGACVCVWDPATGAGGMVHFLLPEAGNAPPATRFGDVALRTLFDELAKLGAPEKRLRARVFGGSAPPIVTQGSHLGDRNIEAALAFLKSRLVPIVDKDSGGGQARKILFSPAGGAVSVTRIGGN